MKLSHAFTLGLAMSLTMSIQIFAAPTTTQPTREQAVDWARTKVGTAIDYDGAYGSQCVDLIKGYSNELWNYYELRGDAGAYVSNPLPDDWRRYRAGEAIPEPGDIVVFGAYQFGTGRYGHIGIVYWVDSSRYYYVDYSGKYTGEPGAERSAALNNYTAIIKPSFSNSTSSSSMNSAAEISNGEYYFENYNGGVLTIDDYIPNGANINITDKSGLYRQMWRIEKLYDDSFKLTSMHTGKGVNVEGDGSVVYENNRNIWAWDYVNDGTANWYIVSDGDGWYRIICKKSGKALSVTSGRNVVQRDSDSATDQKWRLIQKDAADNTQKQSDLSDNNSSNNNSSSSSSNNSSGGNSSSNNSSGGSSSSNNSSGGSSSSNNYSSKSNKRNTASWRYDGYGWWLEYADGSYPWSTWARVDGTWYYFNYYGYATTGWEKIGGYWYYFNSDCSMRTGWMQSGGNWYYLDYNGYMLFNTITPDGYFVDAYGICR